MSIRNLFVSILLALASSGCKDEAAGSSIDHSQPEIVVVLCDVSNSVTRLKDKTAEQQQKEATIERLKALVDDLPNHFPEPALLYFLPVSGNTNQPFLSAEPIKIIHDNPVQKQKQAAINQVALSTIKSKLTDLSATGGNSCIADAMGYALKLLKEQAPEDPKTGKQLIVLSDMMETCGQRKIDDLINVSEAQRNVLAQQLADRLRPVSDFSGISAKLTLVNPALSSTEKMDDAAKTLWTRLLKKMNYTGVYELRSTLPPTLSQ